jgi:hypothetical protein
VFLRQRGLTVGRIRIQVWKIKTSLNNYYNTDKMASETKAAEEVRIAAIE